MNLIAAVSRNWGIGNEGKLLFNLSGDLRRFRTLTEGNHVIMGRKTLESLPGGRPLAGRNNIVLSRTLDAGTPGVTVCRDVAELKQLTKKIPTDKLFVIGGGEIYRLLEPLCSYAYITWVDESQAVLDGFLAYLESLRLRFNETKDMAIWREIILLLPSSFNQKRTITMNYETLLNIYHARKNHKLTEWHVLCDWILSLPYFADIIGV